MSDGRVIVGVDIGSAKIVTVIAKVVEEGPIHILGVSELPSHGIRKGQIVDIEEAVKAINASLEAAERMAGYSITHVITSLDGSHIESLNSKGVVAVATPDGEITESDVTRVIDAARAVSLPSTRDIVHVLPRNYTVDGQEGIKDPIGMTGVRLEVDTHIITSSTTAVKNLEKALSEVGVDVSAMVFSGYASSLSVVSETEKELGVVVVDIGAGTTDISVYIEGSIAHSSVLPVGARHITNDLAIGLRVSLESAEKIKLFLSRTPEKQPLTYEETPSKKEKTSDDLDVTSLNLTEDLKKLSYKTLTEGIIRPRLNEIFTMVGTELKRSHLGGQTPAGLIITGGGAKTIGIVESARRMLSMPVRIGVPHDLKGLIDEVQDPAFATAVGLIRFGSYREEQSSFSIGSMKLPKFPRIPGIPKKLVELLKSFLP
jgi:cell division protein FtsA